MWHAAPRGRGDPLGVGLDLTDDEIVQSPIMQNAFVQFDPNLVGIGKATVH